MAQVVHDLRRLLLHAHVVARIDFTLLLTPFLVFATTLITRLASWYIVAKHMGLQLLEAWPRFNSRCSLFVFQF